MTLETTENTCSSVPEASPLLALTVRTPTNVLGFSLHDLLERPAEVFPRILTLYERAKSLLSEPDTRYVGEDEQNVLIQARYLLDRGSKHNHPLAEKFQDVSRAIQQTLVAVQKIERSAVGHTSFEDLFGARTKAEIRAILGETRVIQLTTGCSVGCRNCNFNALLQPRRHLSWDAIVKIVDLLGQSAQKNDIFLYYSSDPLDWTDRGRTYLDVVKLFQDRLGYTPLTTTAVPRGTEELARELWRSNALVRLSVSNSNFTRLQATGFLRGDSLSEWTAGIGQPGNRHSHFISFDDRSADLLFQSGKSFDFTSVEESIGCVTGVEVHPDGLFNFSATRTTPLTPNGYVRFPVGPSGSPVFEAKRTVHDSVIVLQPLTLLHPNVGTVSRAPFRDDQVFQGVYAAQCASILWELDSHSTSKSSAITSKLKVQSFRGPQVDALSFPNAADERTIAPLKNALKVLLTYVKALVPQIKGSTPHDPAALDRMNAVDLHDYAHQYRSFFSELDTDSYDPRYREEFEALPGRMLKEFQRAFTAFDDAFVDYGYEYERNISIERTAFIERELGSTLVSYGARLESNPHLRAQIDIAINAYVDSLDEQAQKVISKLAAPRDPLVAAGRGYYEAFSDRNGFNEVFASRWDNDRSLLEVRWRAGIYLLCAAPESLRDILRANGGKLPTIKAFRREWPTGLE